MYIIIDTEAPVSAFHKVIRIIAETTWITSDKADMGTKNERSEARN
jgi:hypothetical protein